MIRWAVLSVAVLVSWVGACGDACDRSACEAANTAAPATGASGIAGVVLYDSDQVIDDCRECGFASTHLDLWLTSTLVSSADQADAVVHSGSATTSIDASGRYSLPLPAGTYLVCSPYVCASITVLPTQTTTLHVFTGFGPTLFVTYDPVSGEQRVIVPFSVVH